VPKPPIRPIGSRLRVRSSSKVHRQLQTFRGGGPVSTGPVAYLSLTGWGMCTLAFRPWAEEGDDPGQPRCQGDGLDEYSGDGHDRPSCEGGDRQDRAHREQQYGAYVSDSA
jgi:hypothetical protein